MTRDEQICLMAGARQRLDDRMRFWLSCAQVKKALREQRYRRRYKLTRRAYGRELYHLNQGAGELLWWRMSRMRRRRVGWLKRGEF